MIPLPSLLLVSDCLPSLGGEAANDRVLEDTWRKGTELNSNEIASESHSKEANNKHRNSTKRRAAANKRQRRKMEQQPTILPPPPPPSPLRLRRIWRVDPPRYKDVLGGGGHNLKAPFWERQQREEEQKRSPRRRTVASIQRYSQLFAFLVTLASFVDIDDYTLLPTGTLLYTIALSMAWENWTDEVEENLKYLEKLRQYHNQLEKIEREVQKAQFEFHVLRNQPHVDIVALRRTKDDHNGPQGANKIPEDQWIVYADEKKHRPHQQRSQQQQQQQQQHQHQQQYHGPPQYWQPNSKTNDWDGVELESKSQNPIACNSPNCFWWHRATGRRPPSSYETWRTQDALPVAWHSTCLSAEVARELNYRLHKISFNPKNDSGQRR